MLGDRHLQGKGLVLGAAPSSLHTSRSFWYTAPVRAAEGEHRREAGGPARVGTPVSTTRSQGEQHESAHLGSG